MKRTIILMALTLAAVLGCYAQEQTVEIQPENSDSTLMARYQSRRTLSGLKAFFEAGYQWGLEGDDDEIWIWYAPNKFSFSASVGCQFNNFIFVGAGVSADVYRSKSIGVTYLTVPIFGEVRANFLNAKRFVPFADFRMGYGVGDLHGYYMCWQLGVRYALPKRHAVYAACQFDFQIAADCGVWHADWVNTNLGFKVGYEF